jgi:hypothetical protein
MSGSATGAKAIAVCDRCKTKMPYQRLRPDGNSPGLRVCPACWDTKDPYRLPARKTEAITMSNPRPDESLVFDTNYLLAEDGFVISFDGDLLTYA